MHRKRLLTALVVLPLLVWMVYRGAPELFALVVGLTAVLGLKEYFRLVPHPLTRPVGGPIAAVGFAAAAGVIFCAYAGEPNLMLGGVVLNLLISGGVALFQMKSEPDVIHTVFRQALGVVYVPLLLSYLMLIRSGASGALWIFFLFSVVFLGDAAAFYAGTFWGRRKLIPRVSPGKTVEGAVAGLLVGLGGGLLCRWVLNLPVSSAACVVLSLAVAVSAQVGDLFESLLKRSARVKDSGTLLPGHGGVLDRIDATLFSAPVLYFVKSWMIST